jgi:hypothetical protein
MRFKISTPRRVAPRVALLSAILLPLALAGLMLAATGSPGIDSQSASPTVAEPETGAPRTPATSLPSASPVAGTTTAVPLRTNPLRTPKTPSAGASSERTAAAPPIGSVTGTAGGAGKRPYDPIRENGTIFAEPTPWGKPKLALVITGREDGYIEPCGCAGLERMKGGLSRRQTFFKKLRDDGWPIVTMDVGGLVKGSGRQAEIKFQYTVEGMRKILRYDAIALGAGELKLRATEVAGVVASVPSEPNPFVSANVDLFDRDSKMTERKRIVEAGGLKIGITSVLGLQFQGQINNPEVKMSDPVAALTKVLAELKKENCNLLILLAHATLQESKDLAKKFPEFEVVVTAGGHPEPPLVKDGPQIVDGRTRLIETGEKGMYAIVLGLFDNPANPGGGMRVRYQPVPLDSRWEASKEMKNLMRSYQDLLHDMGLPALVTVAANARKELLGGFVGSDKCRDCHEESYKVWKKSGHATAYQTLVKADPPRNFDPECISCHVVGWDGTGHFPYESGFQSPEKTPHLEGVGCESCHGPGEAHCRAETKSDTVLQEQLRKAIVLTKSDAQKRFCFECHDLDNSPDFKFETYWPKVEHKEK